MMDKKGSSRVFGSFFGEKRPQNRLIRDGEDWFSIYELAVYGE